MSKALNLISSFIYNHWTRVTVDSAQTLPIQAPTAAHLGIVYKLIAILTTAPAMIDFVYLAVLLVGTKYWIPKTFDSEIKIIIGLNNLTNKIISLACLGVYQG